MACARQRALASISLSRSRAGLESSSRFFANAFLSFVPFSYTRALESLTAVVPRLDRGSYEALPWSKCNIPCQTLLKALSHAVRADCLLNLKPDAITPHSPTQNFAFHERAQHATLTIPRL